MMKSFSLMLVAVSLCGTFVPAIDGLSCYKCSWSDKSCNTEKLAANTPKEKCGAAATATTTAPAGENAVTTGASDDAAATETAAPADPPAARSRNLLDDHLHSSDVGGVFRVIRSKPFLSVMADPTYHCFQVHVKANDTSSVTVERGCKETAKTDDCVTLDKTQYPKGVVEKCTTCTKDDCNNNGLFLSSNALLIQCSLLFATGIAKMFFQTK